MGSLPRAKAGIGSAMNDVVRELGGTLGVAVLGSILASSYGSSMDDATAGLPHPAAEAAGDSVGAAHEVGAQLAGGAGAKLIDDRRRRVRRRHDHDRHARRRRRRHRRVDRSGVPALARPRRAAGAGRLRAARAGHGLNADDPHLGPGAYAAPGPPVTRSG